MSFEFCELLHVSFFPPGDHGLKCKDYNHGYHDSEHQSTNTVPPVQMHHQFMSFVDGIQYGKDQDFMVDQLEKLHQMMSIAAFAGVHMVMRIQDWKTCQCLLT